VAGLVLAGGLATAADAQAAGPELAIEALTDLRERGISWSGGRPTAQLFLGLPVAGGLAVEARAAGLRGSARHGGADAGFDLGGVWRGNRGPWQLSGGVVGHFFAGRARLNYAEGQARAAYLVGPASIGASLAYAPRQDAIGGDNLYLGADAALAVPGTPVTLDAAFGHASGHAAGRARVRDRALRLRPDGDYWDYRVGLTYVRSPWALTLRLSGTSIDNVGRSAAYGDRHVGRRVTASVLVDL
jgi:hypothetical protein